MNRTVKVKALGKFVALALAMGFGCAVPAYAEEGVAPTSTDDWNFAFSLHVYGDTDGTEWREKDTYTATYINPTYFTGDPCRIYVDGAYNPDGSARDQGCMIGKAYLRDTGKYVIHNNVKERGNRYAQITVWAYRDVRTFTNGLWSPDVSDTSKYTSLN